MWEKYRPEILGVLVAGLVLNLWYLSSLAVDQSIIPRSYSFVIDAVSIIAAAFFGAYSAFLLNQKKEEEKKQLRRINAVNGALFVIVRQANALLNLIKGFDGWKDRKTNFYEMPAGYPAEYRDLRLNLSEIDFLLRESDPNLLFQLSIEQERFEAAITSVRLRTEFHFNELQPALDAANFDDDDASLEDLIKIVGDRIAITAYKSTEDVFSHVYQTYGSLVEAIDELHSEAVRLYPGIEFIKFQPDYKV
jgi:hypothetical protein